MPCNGVRFVGPFPCKSRQPKRQPFMAAPGPNLVLGISERISIGAFLLWVAVLAVVLWKRPAGGPENAGPPEASAT